ncbi:MAG: hypothetical protein WC565_09060 [Parcubacteria group bacterium]|jgi:hypothetical protein
MGWQDLLQTPDETIVCPWFGGRELRTWSRTFRLEGRLPRASGWYEFRIGGGRKATLKGPAEPNFEALRVKLRGYLVGDRLVLDDVRLEINPAKIIEATEEVHFVEPGLDWLVRAVVGRAYEGGPLVFESQDMPLGPEPEVEQAYLDQAESLETIKGVTPSLEAIFRLEVWRRAEAEKRRVELERLRREEEERLAREAAWLEMTEKLGDAIGRRQMAQVDFVEAARAALAVGGATYRASRPGYNRGEMIVQFRHLNRNFECICDQQLRIVDAGVCLTDHDTGVRGDTWFTLESLPSVITEADRAGVLVVFRHVH